MSQHYLADLSELEESGRKIVRIGHLDVALLVFDGSVLAFENTCLHMGGPVGEGMLMNRVAAELGEDGRYRGERFVEDDVHLVCPWHGWEYNLPSGECSVVPGRRLRMFPVTIDEGRVLVELEIGHSPPLDAQTSEP